MERKNTYKPVLCIVDMPPSHSGIYTSLVLVWGLLTARHNSVIHSNLGLKLCSQHNLLLTSTSKKIHCPVNLITDLTF